MTSSGQSDTGLKSEMPSSRMTQRDDIARRCAEAERERDLLRASVDLALPCIRIALDCAERAAQGRAERELKDALYHLTVGTQ